MITKISRPNYVTNLTTVYYFYIIMVTKTSIGKTELNNNIRNQTRTKTKASAFTQCSIQVHMWTKTILAKGININTSLSTHNNFFSIL